MVKKTLHATVARILKPLCRVLIRYGVSYGDFIDIARRVFVEVAEQDFRIEGRKQTNSRIAMLTGIQRKEIARLMSPLQVQLDELDVEYNRGVRVTSGWRRDPDFLDAKARPRTLSFDGEFGFAELVRRYSGDLPARAVLDELLRVGTVLKNEQNQIVLQSDAVHVPHADKDAQFNIMGHAGNDLFSTIDHNFEAGPEKKRLQLTVAYNNLPESVVRRFQHISHEDCLGLLKKFDVWLAEHDRDSSSSEVEEIKKPNDRYRAGIGIYYFEELQK